MDSALRDFLLVQNKSKAELEEIIKQKEISWEYFHAYYRQLLLIAQYSQQQAKDLELSVADYIVMLQSDERVSFGPAANLAEQEKKSEPVVNNTPEQSVAP